MLFILLFCCTKIKMKLLSFFRLQKVYICSTLPALLVRFQASKKKVYVVLAKYSFQFFKYLYRVDNVNTRMGFFADKKNNCCNQCTLCKTKKWSLWFALRNKKRWACLPFESLFVSVKWGRFCYSFQTSFIFLKKMQKPW